VIRSRILTVAIALTVLTVAACSAAPATTPVAGATSYLEFRDGFCSAFDDLFRAIGNPDTAADSALMASLEQAISAGDAANVERLSAEIRSGLESARAHARFAGGWAPASSVSAPMDAMFVAFETYVEAKRAASGQGLDAAEQAAQRAFEGAGGLEAWTGMQQAFQDPAVMAAIASARPAGMEPQCPTVPISI
jgi:hypothetical protein